MTVYERITHTADLAIRVWGDDWPTLFQHAAIALFDMMSEPSGSMTVERSIELDAPDAEALFVDWLNELIYLHEVEGETYTQFIIDAWEPEHLSARIVGATTGRKVRSIKAATYHDLCFTQTMTCVQAQIVFDV